MVWTWSRAGVLAAGDGDSALPAPRRILPESLLRGQARPDGHELVALEEGFEGRVWRDGVLVGSRWWPEVPSTPEWNLFLRGAGATPGGGVPPANAYPLSATGWARVRSQGLRGLAGEQRGLLVALALAVMAGVLAALLVGVLSLQASIWQVQKDIAAREAAIAPILAARDAAHADAAAVQRILASRPPAGQVQLMAAVSNLMGGPFQVLEWKLPDPQHLTVVARMPSADPRRIVTAWEGSGLFADVSAQGTRQADEIEVKARILASAAKPAAVQ